MHYIYSILGRLSSGTTTSSPGKGSVVVAGHAPAISVGFTASPGHGTVTLSGHAPVTTTFGEYKGFPGAGSITITGYVPALIGHPFTPPVLGPGDDSVPLHWRKRDPRMQPVFSPVLRRKVSEPEPVGAIEEPNTGDDLYKDAEQRAAMLKVLDEHIAALRHDEAARGLARMARDAGRRAAADKVRQASERARKHASKAMRIAERLSAGRLWDDGDE